MSEPLWQLENVRMTSRGHVRLDVPSLRIEKGITAVLGESGAGKTSLLNALVGFETITSGRLTRAAALNDLADMDGGIERPPLFWVPQDFGLWPHLTARQHLADVMPKQRDDLQAGDALTDSPETLLGVFDLLDRADAKPNQLSQGEKSRLAVARALATQARVLVMDEPLSAVDSGRLPDLWQQMVRRVRDAKSSLIFATHDPKTVQAYAEQVIVLHARSVLFEGEPRTLYFDPPNEQAAACMGAFNWLTADDATDWLSVVAQNTISGAGMTTRTDSSPCVRPEHLRISVDPDGRSTVESFVFRGPTSIVTLKHVTSHGARQFVVRSPDTPVVVGDRVSLHDERPANTAWKVGETS